MYNFFFIFSLIYFIVFINSVFFNVDSSIDLKANLDPRRDHHR